MVVAGIICALFLGLGGVLGVMLASYWRPLDVGEAELELRRIRKGIEELQKLARHKSNPLNVQVFRDGENWQLREEA